MIVVNTDFIPGREIKETLGLVRGNTIRAKGLGKDIKAAFRNITGGKIDEYVEMLSESREEAVNHPSQIFGFGRGLKKLLWRGGRLA